MLQACEIELSTFQAGSGHADSRRRDGLGVATEHGDIVIFGVPLISRSTARDWSRVTYQLAATLGSMLGQRDPNFRVVIAGEDVREIPVPQDARIEILRAPVTAPVTDIESMRSNIEGKRRLIAGRARDKGGGYLMFVDADDLVSANLVGYVRRGGPVSGYIARDGYVYDARTGALALYPLRGFEPWPLDRVCGSTAIVRLGGDELPGGSNEWVYTDLFGGRHKEVRNRCEAADRPLTPLPFRAVVYVRATGENISFRADREDPGFRFHTWLIQEIAPNAIERSPELDAEFNLEAAVLR